MADLSTIQDECPEQDRDDLLHFLNSIRSCIRFFITSRPHIDLATEFENVLRIDIVASYDDVKAYLTPVIKKNSKLARLIARDAKLEAEIVDTIAGKTGGM